MLFVIATGNKIDPDRATRFGTLIDTVFSNPFRRDNPQTAMEITDYLCGRIDELIAEMG